MSFKVGVPHKKLQNNALICLNIQPTNKLGFAVQRNQKSKKTIKYVFRNKRP